MIDQIVRFIHSNYQVIPASVRLGLGIVFCMGSVSLLAICGYKKGMKYVSGLLLIECLFLVYAITVFFRSPQPDRMVILTPFKSYHGVLSGSIYAQTEALMNVVTFVPLGFLLGYSSNRIKWWKVLLLGGIMSLGIEVLQFILKRGYAEFDDVFHNVLGCMIGFGLYEVVDKIIKSVSDNRRAEAR